MKRVVACFVASMVIGGLSGVSAGSAAAAAGDLDPDFTPPAINGSVYSAFELDGGGLLIGGFFTDVGGAGSGTGPHKVMKLDANGILDTNFIPKFFSEPLYDNNVEWKVKLSTNQFLVGGDFTTTADHKHLARVNTDGSLDNDFKRFVR